MHEITQCSYQMKYCFSGHVISSWIFLHAWQVFPLDFELIINRGQHLRGSIKPRPNDRNMSTQHIATLLGATCCVRLATMLWCVATCWVLLAQIWNWSNLSQQHPTCRNKVAKRTQHVVPNNVAICCVDMLRSFGRGFRMAQFLLKIEKLSNIMGPRGSQDSRSPSPIMAPE